METALLALGLRQYRVDPVGERGHRG